MMMGSGMKDKYFSSSNIIVKQLVLIVVNNISNLVTLTPLRVF